jgi:antitoxin Phd
LPSVLYTTRETAKMYMYMAIWEPTMTRDLSIAEARDGFTRLIHDTERGERVRITRRGKPVAVLLSLDEYERLQAGGADLGARLAEFRARYEDDLEGLAASLEGLRDRSPGREVTL